MARRDALKALGAGVLAASGSWMLGRNAAAATPELRYAPEKGAQLRFLRWKRFVQGDEDQWLANTRKFTEQTGVPVQVESVSLEDLPSKAAMAANVGAGPDIVHGKLWSAAAVSRQMPGPDRARQLSCGQVRRLV